MGAVLLAGVLSWFGAELEAPGLWLLSPPAAMGQQAAALLLAPAQSACVQPRAMPVGPEPPRGSWLPSADGGAERPLGVWPSAGPEGDGPRPKTARPPPRPRVRARVSDTSRRWMVRLVLLPVTLLLLALAGYGLWYVRRTPGLPLAAGFCFLLGLCAIWPALSAPHTGVLTHGREFTDPINSIEAIAALGESLPRLTDVTTLFSFPEGVTWITQGPSWLAYLLVLPLGLIFSPLVAHNLGVGLGVALLALSVWGMARNLGAGPLTALLAAAGSGFAPVLLQELDTISLDRATLFMVPLFFICMDRAAHLPGWRWPVAAGVALAALFYGQIYYGLYMAAATPFLVLPRLWGRDFPRRLGRMALMGTVAAVLLAPGLLVLRSSTKGTSYEQDRTRLAHKVPDIWNPVDLGQAADFVRKYKHGGHLPMASPQQRLLSSMAMSINSHTAAWPERYMAGGSLYWALLLVALGLATCRRLVLIAGLDVAVLVLFSLGPFLTFKTGVTNVPLPYYAYFLLVPGFESLKNTNRIILMAVCISSVPLALGLAGLVERVQAWRPNLSLPLPAKLGLMLVAAFLLTSLHLPTLREITHVGPVRNKIPLVTFPRPKFYKFPIPKALQQLEPGAALVLPLQEQMPIPATVAVLRSGWEVVNAPSYGIPRRRPLPMWVEANAFLSQVAFESGSDRARRRLVFDDPPGSLKELRKYKLRYIVMFRRFIKSERDIKKAEAFCDRFLTRAADDGQVVVWDLWRPKKPGQAK